MEVFGDSLNVTVSEDQGGSSVLTSCVCSAYFYSDMGGDPRAVAETYVCERVW